MLRLLFLGSLVPAAWGGPGPDHPVMRAILDRAGAGAPAPCVQSLGAEFARIASAEDAEVKFVLKDMRDSTCRVSFMGAGHSDGVATDPEAESRELNDPRAEHAASVHTHPLGNAAYFGRPGSYADNLEFVPRREVFKRELPETVYQRLQEQVRAGGVPGFNLSPPSTMDLFAVSGDGDAQSGNPPRIANIVLTSGGRWTYWSTDPKKLRGELDDMGVWASAFRIVDTARGSPAVIARARTILDAANGDPGRRAFMEDWGRAALLLRAPYSAAALARLDAGDGAGVRQEFEEKVRQADRFCELLGSMGVWATFAPFP